MKDTKNRLSGTWKLVSAVLEINGASQHLFGNNPGGLLVFTKEMWFNVVLNDMDVPKFSTEDRAQGTFEELLAATKGALALYGTYTVNENGDFESQHVIGSTFPNWNGLERNSTQLRLEREGNFLTENLFLEETSRVIIRWQLVE